MQIVYRWFLQDFAVFAEVVAAGLLSNFAENQIEKLRCETETLTFTIPMFFYRAQLSVEWSEPLWESNT